MSNLERLILKATMVDAKKQKKKRREALAKIQLEQNIPASISGGSGSKSSGGNSLLRMEIHCYTLYHWMTILRKWIAKLPCRHLYSRMIRALEA